MGWLTGWTYRKNHYINPASGAGQNYQKRIVVYYGAGADSDENVYLDGKCLTDFGDVRFTDKTGISLLDYWIEKKVDSDYAICWVEVVEDLSIYNRKIYIYYNKAGAASIANGDNTFLFFDDFEIDLSKWFVVGSPVISTDHAYSGSKCVKFPSLQSAVIQKLVNPFDGKATHVHFYDQLSPLVEYAVFSNDAGEPEVSYIGIQNDIGKYEYELDGITYNSGIDRIVGWHEFVTRSSGGLKQFLVDGNIMTVTGIGNYNPVTFLFGINVSEVDTYWDTVFIRKWTNPEPVHGIWGSEEDDGIGITIFNAEDIVQSDEEAPMELEDIIYSLSQNPESVEDIMVALTRLKTWFASDILYALSGSVHVPILSENILVELLRIRIREVAIEFGISEPEIINIILTTQGELLRRLTSKLYEKL